MEAHFTMLQITNTMCCVGVRSLEHGSGQAKCVLISDSGTLMEGHTLMLPLSSLQHEMKRSDMKMIGNRTLEGYFNEGKDYGKKHLCFMFYDGSADIVTTLARIYLVPPTFSTFSRFWICFIIICFCLANYYSVFLGDISK